MPFGTCGGSAKAGDPGCQPAAGITGNLSMTAGITAAARRIARTAAVGEGFGWLLAVATGRAVIPFPEAGFAALPGSLVHIGAGR
jgi:hypothetical protein